ncbi:hypothetical protein DFJ73DRAFT_621872 [Zopfochytrium polystomum]|nr:hypothetical protein DFJ73DRAFT_621872 [Zopfochytrium polystomum]
MSDQGGALYCAEQIKIPPELPDILKNYAKHVIRTQPSDIMSASAEYFGRLARQKAPVGQRLTRMQLEAFYTLFSRKDKTVVARHEVEDACEQAGIPSGHVTDILNLGNWGEKIPWLQFWTLLVASSTGTLLATVDQVCEILGDNGRVPTRPVVEIIKFLVSRDPALDPVKINKVTAALQMEQLSLAPLFVAPPLWVQL